jgi:hypothetical protein
MTEDETAALLKNTQDCLETECSIDEVGDLLSVLKGTESELKTRLAKISEMISQLDHLNEKEERQTDEVRAFVKDMLRVFNTDKPGFAPMGFVGDTKNSGKTAYDVLPPKKWTNPDP